MSTNFLQNYQAPTIPEGCLESSLDEQKVYLLINNKTFEAKILVTNITTEVTQQKVSLSITVYNEGANCLGGIAFFNGQWYAEETPPYFYFSNRRVDLGSKVRGQGIGENAMLIMEELLAKIHQANPFLNADYIKANTQLSNFAKLVTSKVWLRKYNLENLVDMTKRDLGYIPDPEDDEKLIAILKSKVYPNTGADRSDHGLGTVSLYKKLTL